MKGLLIFFGCLVGNALAWLFFLQFGVYAIVLLVLVAILLWIPETGMARMQLPKKGH
jgi:hypothetical protein